MHVFYDHLIDLNDVRAQLQVGLTEEQLIEVLTILDEALHHRVFEVVLSALPPHTHDRFVEQFAADPTSSRHLEFIQQYAPDIEQRIRLVSQQENRKFIDAIHE